MSLTFLIPYSALTIAATTVTVISTMAQSGSAGPEEQSGSVAKAGGPHAPPPTATLRPHFSVEFPPLLLGTEPGWGVRGEGLDPSSGRNRWTVT